MRVTSKGQVTIPKPIREQLGIGPGSEVEFVESQGVVRLVAGTDLPAGDERSLRFRKALERMAGSIDTGGLDGKAYVDRLRGRRDDLDAD